MIDFEDVYNEYFKDVYRYILSICRNESTAEEVTQEAFFKALKSIDSFQGKCSIYVWLCQIAKNTYLSMCKKDRNLDYDTDLNTLTESENFMQKLLIGESAFEIHQILHNLDEPYKEVFSLRTFGELSFAKIGQLFGKTESWARVTYYRAKIKIREDLE